MRFKNFFGASVLALVFMFTMCVFTACGERVESLTLDTSKVVTELDYNQDLDLSNLVVTANYTKESKVLKDNEYKVDKGGFDKTIAGSYTITISYGNKSAGFKVSVNPDIQNAVGIELKTEIATKEFDFGASYSSFGLGVYAVFDDNTKSKLSDNQFTIDSSAYNANVAGTYTIVVTLKDVLYDGNPITASYAVTVKSALKTVKSLRVDTTGAKTEFEWDDAFTYEGLRVYRVFSDGSEELASDVSVNSDSFKAGVCGEYTIIVSVPNGTASLFQDYKVIVKPRPSAVVTSIELDLTTNNVKTTFEYGEAFNSSNLLVSKIMSYGDNEVALPSEFTVDSSAYNANVAGTYTIVVTLKDVLYNGNPITASYNVTVSAPVQNGITLNTSSVKTSYYLGEELTLENLIVSKTYANSTFVDNLTTEEYEVDNSRFNNTIAGTYTIVITQKDSTFSKSFDVTVLNEAKILRIEVSGAKTNFAWGEDFNSSGIVVKKIISFGDPVTLDSSEYTIDYSAYKKDVAGTYSIKVSLNGTFIVSTYDVIVGERPAPDVTGITLDTKDVKTVFAWGDDFSAEGLVVLKQMSYGDPIKAETSEYTVNAEKFDKSTAGEYSIVVTLKGTEFSVTYSVTVSKPTPVITGWRLNTVSVKKTFAWGESLDVSGLIVIKEMNTGDVEAEESEYTIDSSYYSATTSGEYNIRVICSDDTILHYVVTVSSITSEQLKEYAVFKEIELTTPSGEVCKIPYREDVTEYEFLTFETGKFEYKVIANNNFVTIYQYETSFNNVAGFNLYIDDVCYTFTLRTRGESPVEKICIGSEEITSLNKMNKTFLIENGTYSDNVDLEVCWVNKTNNDYSWRLDKKEQSLDLVNMKFEDNKIYVVEIVSNDYVIQTLTIKVVPKDSVDHVSVSIKSGEQYISYSFERIDVDTYYAYGDVYDSDYTFSVYDQNSQLYTIKAKKENKNVVYGDNVFNIEIYNGETYIKTITVIYHYLFDITLDNSFENVVITPFGVYAETYSTTLEDQDIKYTNLNGEAVSTLNVGENNLIGTFTQDGLTYQFSATFKVVALSVTSVFIDNEEYKINDVQTSICIRKDFFSTAVVRFEYASTEKAGISGKEYISGTDFEFVIKPDDTSLYIYMGENSEQTIDIVFLENTLIKKVVVKDQSGEEEVTEGYGGYHYSTNGSFECINVTVEDGYTYKIFSGNAELKDELKVGENALQINIYDIDNNLVEVRKFYLSIHASFTLTDENGDSYSYQLNNMANAYSLNDFDITKKLNFGDDCVVSMDGKSINRTNITLTDNISKLSLVITGMYFKYSGSLYVYKANVLKANELFSGIWVSDGLTSISVDIHDDPNYVLLPLSADLTNLEVKANFLNVYNGYDYSSELVDGEFIVTVYDADKNKVTDVVIIPIKRGLIDNDTRLYYSVASMISSESDYFLEDNKTINVPANSVVNIVAFNDCANIEISGVDVVDMMNEPVVIFAKEGSYTMVIKVTATNGAIKTYNIPVVVAPAEYAFEVTYNNQTKRFGGFERDDTSFEEYYGQDYNGYVGRFDLDTTLVNTANKTIKLEFTTNEDFALVCGEKTITNGVNYLPYTETDYGYLVTISTNILGSLSVFELRFESSVTFATFTIDEDVRTFKMYADGAFSPAFMMTQDSVIMTIYNEDNIIKETTDSVESYHVVLSITNLASGYSVIDFTTGKEISDISNIKIQLQKVDMEGLSVYSGAIMCADAENNKYSITFIFSDLVYIAQNMMA